MSAWIVKKKHIDFLVTAALESMINRTIRGEIDGHPVEMEISYNNADKIGATLWAENIKSVNYRYSNHKPSEVSAYRFTKHNGGPIAIVVIKQIDCLDYQSCEHDGWKNSWARRFCDELKDAMIYSLPGYNNAPWGID